MNALCMLVKVKGQKIYSYSYNLLQLLTVTWSDDSNVMMMWEDPLFLGVLLEIINNKVIYNKTKICIRAIKH